MSGKQVINNETLEMFTERQKRERWEWQLQLLDELDEASEELSERRKNYISSVSNFALSFPVINLQTWVMEAGKQLLGILLRLGLMD